MLLLLVFLEGKVGPGGKVGPEGKLYLFVGRLG
jgi:hypothetical protein